jgi:Zn-dependent protease
MESQIRLGRVFGIPIGLHYSWIIIALLLTFSLADRFGRSGTGWSGTTAWLSALAASALFFASILVHELAHALVARARGVPVRSISLFALGGVTRMDRDAADPKTEFWMGIVGPLTSVALGALALGAAWLAGWRGGDPGQPLAAVAMWLGYINLVLGVFNLIPAFPLDGGRVLRALVWWSTRDPFRATRLVSRIGQLVGFGFIVLGLSRFFGGAGFGALWLAFIGWFVIEAAQASYAQVTAEEALRGVRVRDLMSRDVPMVDGRVDVRTFVEQFLARTGRRLFIVRDHGQATGLVTPHQVKELEGERWAETPVEAVMRPLSDARVLPPDASAREALEIMSREDLNQLPVIRDGRVEGVVSRAHIVQALQTRAELAM